MLTNEQVKARAGRIGGSDCAAALGLNPWKSRHRLWLEKTGRLEPKDLSDNEKVYWGEQLESFIFEYYERQHPKHKLIFNTPPEVHPEHDFMVANYDGLATDEDGVNYVLEIKNVGFMMAKEWEDVETLPAQYEAQVRHYLAVSGCNYGVIVALIGGQQYKEFRIDRDLDIEAKIIEGEKQFIEFVKNDTEPDILFCDAQKDVSNAIKEYNLKHDLDDTPINIDNPELIRLPAEIKDLQKKIKELEKQVAFKQNQIKLAMAESTFGYVGNYIVTYKPQQSNRIDSKAIRDNYPKVAEECSKISVSQVLRIKKNKEK